MEGPLTLLYLLNTLKLYFSFIDWEELYNFTNISLSLKELLQLLQSAFRARITLNIGVHGLMKVFHCGISFVRCS
jgi:hypothetical protein